MGESVEGFIDGNNANDALSVQMKEVCFEYCTDSRNFNGQYDKWLSTGSAVKFNFEISPYQRRTNALNGTLWLWLFACAAFNLFFFNKICQAPKSFSFHLLHHFHSCHAIVLQRFVRIIFHRNDDAYLVRRCYSPLVDWVLSRIKLNILSYKGQQNENIFNHSTRTEFFIRKNDPTLYLRHSQQLFE